MKIELKKFKKIEDQAIKLLLDYYQVKTDIFKKRGIEIPEVLQKKITFI